MEPQKAKKQKSRTQSVKGDLPKKRDQLHAQLSLLAPATKEQAKEQDKEEDIMAKRQDLVSLETRSEA